MRSAVAYLVVLMVMLACFAVFHMNPTLTLTHRPGNLVVGLALLCGGIGVALRRPWSYPIGLAASGVAVIGGLLSLRGWLGTLLPGFPVIWVVAGLYLAFRLTMNRHAAEEARRRAAAQAERDTL